MTSETLTKLKDELAARQQDRDAAFRKLALSLVDGQLPDAKRVEAVLTGCGKTLAELESYVNTLTERRALLEEREKLPGLEAERQQVAKEIDAEMQRWRELEAEHEATLQPIVGRLRFLETETRRLDSLKNRLFDLADPALKAEIKAVPAQQRPIHDALDERRKQLAGLATKAAVFDRRTSDEALQMLTAAEAAQRSADAVTFRRQAGEMRERIEAAIADLQAELDGLVSRERELYELATTTL